MKRLFIIFFTFIFFSLYSIPPITFDYAKGPLYGKNFYPPYTIYLNFPNHSAAEGREFELQYHISTYLTNDFMWDGADFDEITEAYYRKYIVLDYDGLVNEIGLAFNLKKFLQFGLDMRIIAYYGGFMDDVVEWFHKLMGLYPDYNGGRELIAKYLVNINIVNDNHVPLQLDHPAVSFGDIDLWVKYTFFQNRWVAFGAVGAFKIPSGQPDALSGSGYPDFGFQILTDFKPVWLLSFYLNAGLVIPFDSFLPSASSKPYPMFNGLIAIELNPLKLFSLIGQMNIKTSPIHGNVKIKNNLYLDAELFSSPQTNILVGVKFKYRGFIWQFYVEENAFTLAGTDVTFNLLFSHDFKIVP